MSSTIEIAKQGFKIVHRGFEFYNVVVPQIVPWISIEENVKKLDLYSGDYSLRAAEIIGEIKTMAYNATDNYFSANQTLREWCGLSSKLLSTYKTLFDKHDESNFPAQKQLLLKVLDDGLKNITAAHVKLEEVSSNFSSISGKSIALLAQLAIDFDNNSQFVNSLNARIRREATATNGDVSAPFGLILPHSVAARAVQGQIIPEMQEKFIEIKDFYEHFKGTIERANTDIKNAKKNLDTEIGNDGYQSASTIQNQTFTPLEMERLHDDIIGFVDSIVIQCQEFKLKSYPKN